MTLRLPPRVLISLLLLAALPMPLRAAEAPAGDLFIAIDPARVDTSMGFDPADEKLYESTRDAATEDEINNQKNAKAGIYNTIFDEMRNERYESVLLEIKKYVECVRQIYGPKEPAYQEVVAESLSLFARSLAGKEDWANAIRCYQLILQKYKDAPVAPKSALDWARISAQLYSGKIREGKGLTKPSQATLLKRILFVKTVKPGDESVADAYLLAADVLLQDKNPAEAKKYLDLIEKDFPKSPAADVAGERRGKL